jgi:hypothetical protein
MRWPNAGFVTQLAVVERNMTREYADNLLNGIEAGTSSRCLLPWLPLMTGGDNPVIIERWKKIAEAEPDFRVKATYASLARVFADAADRKPIWDKALEGWNVRESSVVKEWRDEGQAEGYINVILDELNAKGSPVPQELVVALRGQSDHTILRQWVSVAIRCADVADFRQRTGLS